MKKLVWSMLAILASLPLLAQSPTTYALTGVQVLEPSARSFYPATILIYQDKITAILEPGLDPLPDSLEVVDLPGRYLLPGLIDAHVHLGMLGLSDSVEAARYALRRWLYSGVTSVRDMGGDARLLAYEQLKIFTGEVAGPDIYYSATFGGNDFISQDRRVALTSRGLGPGWASWSQRADTAEDPALMIARARGAHVSGIKFYLGVEAERIAELTREAHRQGLRSWAHLTVFPDRPDEVVRAGVDVVSHLWGAMWQDADVDPARRVPYTHTSAREARTAILPDLSLIEADSPEMQELFQLMVDRQVIWDLTYSAVWRKDSPVNQKYKELAQAGSRAGVRLATGTDYYNPPEALFPSLFTEIELLVAHGVMSPEQALRAATLTGAEVIGIESTHGSLEVGKRANLIVLRENPLENIKALRSLELTIKNGRRYLREDY